MGYKPTSNLVMNYLMDRPNETVKIEDIATACKLERVQVISALSAQRRNGQNIQWEIRGISVKFLKSESPTNESSNGQTKRVFEEIGVGRHGDIVIQDECGMLYKAVEL
jgi:hypothetical protein